MAHLDGGANVLRLLESRTQIARRGGARKEAGGTGTQAKVSMTILTGEIKRHG